MLAVYIILFDVVLMTSFWMISASYSPNRQSDYVRYAKDGDIVGTTTMPNEFVLSTQIDRDFNASILAMQNYYNANGNTYPAAGSWTTALYPTYAWQPKAPFNHAWQYVTGAQTYLCLKTTAGNAQTLTKLRQVKQSLGAQAYITDTCGNTSYSGTPTTTYSLTYQF